MNTKISHIPFYERLRIPDGALLVAGLAYVLPAVLLLVWKPILAAAFAVIPLVILLISHGPVALYLLVAATFIFFPWEGWITFLPGDVVAFFLILAFLVDLIRRGKRNTQNRLTGVYFFYLVVSLMSIALEGFTGLSLRFFGRQIILFATFLAVVHFSSRLNIRMVFVVFVLAAAGNSVISTFHFLSALGAIRVFGIAGRGFGDHAAIGLILGVMLYLWSSDIRARIFWGICCLLITGGLMATQTRASIITAGWSVALLIFFALRSAKPFSAPWPRKNLLLAGGLALIAIPLLALYLPIFEGISDRFAHLSLQASGTVLLRISLWTAALKAFWANPIFGIGSGNFAQVWLWVPEVRFDPLFFMVSGFSTHAIIFTALAETGIFGLAALAVFFTRAVKLARRKFRTAATFAETGHYLGLYIIALAILGSSIYAGSWFWGNNSYHMAIFFGLIAGSPRPLSQSIAGGAVH